MKEVMWLVAKTLKVLFKNKLSFLLTIGLPIVGIFISFLIYGGGSGSTVNVGIVNHDPAAITTDTVKFIKGLNHVKVKTVKASQAKKQVTSRKLDLVITFDHGFAQSIQDGHPDHIRIASIKGASVTGFVKSYLNTYINNIASFSKISKGDKTTFNHLYADYQQATFKVKIGTLSDTSKNKDMTYQTIGYLMMFMLFSAVSLSTMITKEKENRTYFRLLSTPIDAKKYVLSNIIANMMIMVLQIIITLVVMTQVFHIQLSIPIWEMFVTLLLFAFIAIGLSLAIIAFAGSSSMANAMQNLIITPTCLLAGCFFPVDIMPDAVKKIADFLPQHWLLDTITKLQDGQSFAGLYLNFMILLAFAAAFFLIAIYKFSRQNSVKNFV